MNQQQNFHDFLIGYNDFLDQMIEIQKLQLEAVLSRKLPQIEKSIQTLQSDLMKLDNMEKKRLELQANAGFENMTFRQIIEKLPEEQKYEYQRIFENMEKKISDISYYNSKSQEKVKLDMSALDKVSKTEAQKSVGVYNANKKPEKTPHSTFESKV